MNKNDAEKLTEIAINIGKDLDVNFNHLLMYGAISYSLDICHTPFKELEKRTFNYIKELRDKKMKY
jgi:hypothetical protein